MKCTKNSRKKNFAECQKNIEKEKSHVIRREWPAFSRLHRDPPKRVRHGAHKNDRGKDRAEVFDHELEDGFPLERMAPGN